MKRDSTSGRQPLQDPRPSREATLEELLDRESRQKTVQSRKTRQGTLPEQKIQPKKDVGDKNLRINNLQKEFEELKNKIKHVENKNERILTKLKSFKDDSREKSRSRANNSIHKDKSGQLSNQHSIAHSLGPIAQYPNATVSFGRDDRPTQDVFYTQNQRKEDRPTQDYLTRYPLKESVNSSYGLLMEENVALKQSVEFLKLQVDKYERTLASRSQMYDEKQQFYKDMVESKDQQIQKLKEPRNRAEMRRLVEWLNTTERANAETRYTLEKRVKELDDRLGRALKLVKLCERTIKEQKAINSQKRPALQVGKTDLEFFSLKEKQLENIIDQLQKDQRKMRTQNSEATREAEQARVRLEALKESHEEELKELRNKYTTRMSAIEKKYTDQLKHTAEDISQLKRQRDDAMEQLTDQKLLLTKARKQLAELEQRSKKADARFAVQLEDVQHETAQLKDKLATSQQQRDSLQFELDKLRMGRSMKDSDLLSTDRNEKQVLNHQIRTLKLEVERQELELASLKRDNWQLGLKLKKKQQFKVELEEVYRDKLQEETRGAAAAREEKRKLELELNQLKNQLAGEDALRERLEREIIQEVELLAVLDGDSNSFKSLLELYKNDPTELPLEVIRLLTDSKRTEAEDRERIVKLVQGKKVQLSGVKRIEVQAVEQLVMLLGTVSTELRLKDQAVQQMETRGRWEKQLLEQEVSKLKKSNEELKRHREKDELEKKQRKSEVAQVKQSMEEEQKERYAELRTLILKSEAEKKELEKRLKILQFEMDELKETFEQQIRRRDRSDADRQRQLEECKSRMVEKDERLREFESEVRDIKEDGIRKKRQLSAELRKIQYDLTEKINKLEHQLEEKESQLQFKEEQIASLNVEVNSLNGSLTAQKTKLSKELTETDKSLRETLTKKEEQVRAKATELAQVSAAHHELVRRLAQLEHQLRQRDSQDESLRQTLEREKEKNVGLQRMRQSQRSDYEQKLKLKKQNEELLTKRLDLKNSEAFRYQQQSKQLKQRLEETNELMQQHEKIQDTLIQKESQLIQLQQKIRTLDEQRKQEIEARSEQNQDHSLKIMKLEGHIRNIEDQLTSQEEQIDKLKGSLHLKQAEVSKAVREMEACQQQLRDRDGQFEQLRGLHDKAIGSNEGLKKEAQQYSTMLKASEEKQNEINDLRKRIEQLISSKNETEEKLRLATEAIGKAQSKSQKHEQELETAMERERLAYEQRLQQQKKQLEKQQSRLQQTHISEKENLLEEQRRGQTQLKSKISSLEDNLKKTTRDLDQVRSQLKSTVSNSDTELNNLRNEFTALREAKQEAEELVRQLQSQLQSLSRAPSMKSLKSLKDIRSNRLATNEDEMHYNFEMGLSKVDPQSANFFSIGQDEPVKKKEPQVAQGPSEAQLKEFFDRIRTELEKVLNEDEISVEIFEVLPGELADDFQQLVTSIRGRIMELNERAAAQELSFVYIDQQEQVYFGDSFIEDFPELAPTNDPQEMLQLHHRLSEQQKVIHNLTSEKQQHQQTINQLTQEKEEAEEQNEARFITQLGVMKKQLKEFKDRMDSLDSLLSTTKRTLFRVLQILLSEYLSKQASNQKLDEDLAEALNHYMSVVKLQEKDKQLLTSYFQKYTQRSKSASKKSWFG